LIVSKVWGRASLVATHLVTASRTQRQNDGLSIIPFTFFTLTFGWSLFWFVGVCKALESNQPLLPVSYLFSFYWVHQVLHNTTHVTVAGVIGSWWFGSSEDRGSGCVYSSTIRGALYRAMSYSFGSICFGSFLGVFVQALRALRKFERKKDCNLLLCIIQCDIACLSACLQDIKVSGNLYLSFCGGLSHVQ
jgi:Plasma-membrane choline transporter